MVRNLLKGGIYPILETLDEDGSDLGERLVSLLGTWDSSIYFLDPETAKVGDLVYDDDETLPVRPLVTSAFVQPITEALRCPSKMERRFCWSAIVDRLHRHNFGQPGDALKATMLQGQGKQVALKRRLEENRPMTYEAAFLLAAAAPADAAPRLPRRFGGQGL
mmetsp:Transcript_19116/g.62319  ORF Transcript_19116/g.62319 Transcript_19116/m.62319 type:complete len:163 (+) Transcript_19116:2592-3080(+)